MAKTPQILIVMHCAVSGRLAFLARKYSVGPVRPYAQHPVSVSVWYTPPRARRPTGFTITPDNIRFLTIEVDGRVVYDSRADVPCDREKWEETNARFAERPAIQTVRHYADGTQVAEPGPSRAAWTMVAQGATPQ